MTRVCTSLALLLLLPAASVLAQSADDAGKTAQARVAEVLAASPLIDGHVDLMIHFVGEDKLSLKPVDAYDIAKPVPGQLDIPRMRAGGMGGGIFTIGINDEARREESLKASTDLMRALAARNPDDLAVVTSADGLAAAMAAKRIGMLMGLEGGDQIGGSLAVLRSAYAHGVRAMTLTWEKTNDIGDSNAEAPRHDGLSRFGEDVVAEMNRLGMLVDLSHAADSTAADVLAIAHAPVILSHSSARALAPASRNVPDALLRKLAVNGGVAMVTYVAYFTTPEYLQWYERGEAEWTGLLRRFKGDRKAAVRGIGEWEQRNPRPTVALAAVADHLDHMRAIAGEDHVGIGADFDGMDDYVIPELRDASTHPALLLELARRGWTDGQLRKLTGANFMRVLRRVEAVAAVK
jgi:membrane dipeptidase